jgi:hypothetical protein
MNFDRKKMLITGTILCKLMIISFILGLSPLSATDVTILPGQSKTFSHTIFNSEATSYSISVSTPGFITFTDLGASSFMSSITLKFRLSVSLFAPGGTHKVSITYRLNAGFPSWMPYTYNVNTGVTAIEDHNADIPLQFFLSENYPNPFNPTTTIEYQIPKKTTVNIKIYNLMGQEVLTLVNEEKNTGLYSVNWDGKDNYGRMVPSGVYMYQMQAGTFFDVKKMILLK